MTTVRWIVGYTGSPLSADILCLFRNRDAAQCQCDNLNAIKSSRYAVIECSLSVIDIERCEHGIRDGDFCEPCNREYKQAFIEHQREGNP